MGSRVCVCSRLFAVSCVVPAHSADVAAQFNGASEHRRRTPHLCLVTADVTEGPPVLSQPPRLLWITALFALCYLIMAELTVNPSSSRLMLAMGLLRLIIHSPYLGPEMSPPLHFPPDASY